MDRKRIRKQQKLLRCREAKQLFVAPLPEAIFAPPVVPAVVSRELSPGVLNIIQQELNLFLSEVHKLFSRTRQRMLLVGAKEARTESAD